MRVLENVLGKLQGSGFSSAAKVAEALEEINKDYEGEDQKTRTGLMVGELEELMAWAATARVMLLGEKPSGGFTVTPKPEDDDLLKAAKAVLGGYHPKRQIHASPTWTELNALYEAIEKREGRR